MEGLATRKVNVHNVNEAQNFFIYDLMNGYNQWYFDKKRLRDLEIGRSYSSILAKVNDTFLDSRNNLRKKIKSFFPRNVKDFISGEEKSILLNFERKHFEQKY